MESSSVRFSGVMLAVETRELLDESDAVLARVVEEAAELLGKLEDAERLDAQSFTEALASAVHHFERIQAVALSAREALEDAADVSSS